MLREQNILFDAALENMAHGLCVFDKDWRVVVRNRRYLELYGLGPDDALPGTPLIELMRRSIDRGMHTTKASAEKFFAEFIRRVTVDRQPVVHRRLTSGKLLAVRHEPLENGGWVGTYEDITERERAAEELKEQHRPIRCRAQQHAARPVHDSTPNMRLIVCNKRYVEMFSMSAEVVRPGMRRSATSSAHSVALGNYRHRNVTLEEHYGNYVACAEGRQPGRAPPSRRRPHHQAQRTSRCRRAAGSRSTRTSPSAIAPKRASRTWRATTR